ncbi:hypothetical protein E2C01_021101 [Portunus trituberculatus]|uniref:Uncharacterized protein n=1 Tax=Portunus trituberculatus TaxID=210409 RepID=A0A5B7E1L4_PORTR|nr:hypothetical protein [Portunus trituberculatus]
MRTAILEQCVSRLPDVVRRSREEMLKRLRARALNRGTNGQRGDPSGGLFEASGVTVIEVVVVVVVG